MRLSWKRFFARLHLLMGGGIVLFFLVMALLSLVWTPFDVSLVDVSQRFQPLGGKYLLGSDQLGRDLLSMLMVGARTSLAVALLAVGMGMLVGVPLGLFAAANEGRFWGEWIMRANDLIFAFPALVIAILITAVFGPSASKAMMAIGIFNIPVFARLVRGSALPLWKQDFIFSARVAGKGSLRISWEHILPNLLNLLLVQGTTQFSLALLAEAGLSYIGLGAQPPLPSWGRMLADSQTLMALAPHVALLPGAAIVLAVLGLSWLGDGLRDLLDPRFKRGSA